MEQRKRRQHSEEHDQIQHTTNETDGNLNEMFYWTEEDSELEDTSTELQRPGRASRERLKLQA